MCTADTITVYSLHSTKFGNYIINIVQSAAEHSPWIIITFLQHNGARGYKYSKWGGKKIKKKTLRSRGQVDKITIYDDTTRFATKISARYAVSPKTAQDCISISYTFSIIPWLSFEEISRNKLHRIKMSSFHWYYQEKFYFHDICSACRRCIRQWLYRR